MKVLRLDADQVRPRDVVVLQRASVVVVAVKRSRSRVTLITSGGVPVDLGVDDQVSVLR